MASTLKVLSAATLAAKAATHREIGVSVKAGRFTVVELAFSPSGTSTVKPLSEPLALADAVRFLNALGRS